MSHTVFCQKLKKQAEGLEKPPYPGELGQRIYETISAEAWQAWVNHQKMLINEYRLNLLDASAKQKLRVEMEKFLFGEGSDTPEGYVPLKKT